MVLVALSAASFPPKPVPGAERDTVATSRGGALHILALGDSYTIGEAVAPEDRWPAQLARRLRASGINAAEPDLVAKTGWTTDELAAGIAEARLRPRYDLVTLLIGVNNQYRGLPIEQYRKQLRSLLGRARDFAGGDPERVIVISIPDWGVTPFAADRDRNAIAAAIDIFNGINQEEAARAGSRWVDVTGISREAAADSALVASDGLHPSAVMYRRWLQVLLPEAWAVLSRN